MPQREGPRAHRDPLGLQLLQQRAGHMLVLEGEGVGAGQDAPHGGRVVSPADRGVGDHLTGRPVGGLDQRAQVHAQPDRRLLHHAGQLPATDHRHYWSHGG